MRNNILYPLKRNSGSGRISTKKNLFPAFILISKEQSFQKVRLHIYIYRNKNCKDAGVGKKHGTVGITIPNCSLQQLSR